MGDELGLETEFVTTPFDGIIPALVAGNCDMIASAMTITDERAEQVNFTDPYFDADQSLLVLAANADEYGSLEDLAGSRIGVQLETTGATYARENAPEDSEIIDFGGGDELFGALISDDIQGALQDFPSTATGRRPTPSSSPSSRPSRPASSTGSPCRWTTSHCSTR
jgi:polar amino acid transport system substrate-binding protein